MQNQEQKTFCRFSVSLLRSAFCIHRSDFFISSLFLIALAAWLITFGGFQSALICFGPLGPGALLVFTLIVIALAMIPAIASELDRILNRVRHPTLRARNVCSVVIGCTSSLFLWLTAASEHRQFFPYIHDEFSYLIQAHQLAGGHLWMPAHPLGSFFESFQLFVNPVYASAYFPGTALLYVPGVWLHLQPFVTSLLVSGAIAGLLFWIATELLDGVAGWLAVLLLLSDGTYRQLSILTLGQMPLLLYSLIAVVAWMRWRSTGRIGWAFAIGFFLGLAAITRPIDALCFAIPIGISILFRRPKHLVFVIAGMIPLLCLQLVLDRGITGHWLQTPFGLYADREYPGTAYGFHPYDPAAKPMSDLPQVRALYRNYQPMIARHRPGNLLHELMQSRLRLVASQCAAAPFPVLILLLPFSILGLTRQRTVLLAVLPLFLMLYGFYVFFFPHYVMTTAPLVIIGILLGAEVLRNAWPSARRFATVGLTLFIAGNAVAALPEWSPWSEDIFRADLLDSVNQQLSQIKEPAVVLFIFDPARNPNEEPVYNADTAWPDDAAVIRANDRGSQDQAIFDYYAKRQQSRVFYRFDEKTRTLTRLGGAIELAL